MNWLLKLSSDKSRIARNIERLKELRKSVHDLAFFAVASQSGGFRILQNLLNNQLVLGRPLVHDKLKEALIGENNQKLILDAPTRAQSILFEAINLIDREIGKEKSTMRQVLRNETT